MSALSLLLLVHCCGQAAFADEQAADLILVVGAPGNAEFARTFGVWADRWTAAAKEGFVPAIVIGRDAETDRTDAARLQDALLAARKETNRPLWLVLIGHGTFDRKTARFNLRGPDVSADELAAQLEPIQRPVAVIDCSASSAPFLTKLSAERRVIISATKSGGEENFARFGDFLSQAIADPGADLDKDDQTSLWEAYLAASRRTAEFYQSDGRLLTEHALLDDNGDQQGTRADIFQGLHLKAGVAPDAAIDGAIAHQWHLVSSDADAQLPPELRRRRDELELQIVALRNRKAALDEDKYYQQLELLLVELARLNQR